MTERQGQRDKKAKCGTAFAAVEYRQKLRFGRKAPDLHGFPLKFDRSAQRAQAVRSRLGVFGCHKLFNDCVSLCQPGTDHAPVRFRLGRRCIHPPFQATGHKGDIHYFSS